ncbi:hypothetical protein I552_7727 [Mycobacterium xenopi 3993]|nr:hypothetical protein I552_7727 [Mycobacterium xenopi 3993]
MSELPTNCSCSLPPRARPAQHWTDVCAIPAFLTGHSLQGGWLR